MQIGNIDFQFGKVKNVYSDEKKATVKLENSSEPYHFYGYQKEKALKLNIGTKIAITKSENNFNNIMRLSTYKKTPTEDGSGEYYIWFASVMAVYENSITTSLGYIKDNQFGKVNVHCLIDNAYNFSPKDTFLLLLKSTNLPKKNNRGFYVKPDKIIKVQI